MGAHALVWTEQITSTCWSTAWEPELAGYALLGFTQRHGNPSFDCKIIKTAAYKAA